MAKTVSKSSLHYSEAGPPDDLHDEMPDEVVDELADPAADPQPGAPETLEFAVPMQASGSRLDQWLAQKLPQYSRNRIKVWIEAGLVTLDGQARDPKHKIRGGEAVWVRPEAAPEQGAYAPEAIALDIVHEDAAIIVINKPAGLVAHPAAGNWSGTLLNALLHHAPQLAGVPRAGIVHRLDKETSGLLVVAKTLEAQTALVRQLQARSVRRLYWALAAGRIEAAGVVDAPLGRHPTQRIKIAVLHEDDSGARPAITHYAALGHHARDGVEVTAVECRLETGRTHQIRVHLQYLGHPLVGDQVYGRAPTKAWLPRQALHARELALVHPVTRKQVGWQAPLPPDLQQLLQSLEPA
jgi:23S rRNA pseudouridine1911/1915/1917 synthase